MEEAPKNKEPFPHTPRMVQVDRACADMRATSVEYAEGVIEEADYVQRRRLFLRIIEGQ